MRMKVASTDEDYDDVSPFFDADENKTYEDKISSTFLKVDWRYPRPGIVYPLYERSQFRVGWNAVRILRETDGPDKSSADQKDRTNLSVLFFCLEWVWYLLPTPLVFLYKKVVLQPLQPLIRWLHKVNIKNYAKLKLSASKKERAKRIGGASVGVVEEKEHTLAMILDAYHGSTGALELIKDCFACIKVLCL